VLPEVIKLVRLLYDRIVRRDDPAPLILLAHPHQPTWLQHPRDLLKGLRWVFEMLQDGVGKGGIK
jgi:hypothetical protein